MIISCMFGGLSLLFSVLFCIFRTSKANVYSLCLKTIASVCFVLCGVFAISYAGQNSVNLMIIAGLMLGLIGDILLDLKIMYPEQSNQYFLAGTTAFAVGHFFYFLSALSYNMATISANLLWNILASVGIAVILTIAIILLSRKMGLNFGKMLYVVIAYSLILVFMTAFSISIAIFNPIYWIFASGMVLFLASDLILSMQYFGNATSKLYVYANHILYYLAQICLAISILFVVV